MPSICAHNTYLAGCSSTAVHYSFSVVEFNAANRNSFYAAGSAMNVRGSTPGFSSLQKWYFCSVQYFTLVYCSRGGAAGKHQRMRLNDNRIIDLRVIDLRVIDLPLQITVSICFAPL